MPLGDRCETLAAIRLKWYDFLMYIRVYKYLQMSDSERCSSGDSEAWIPYPGPNKSYK